MESEKFKMVFCCMILTFKGLRISEIMAIVIFPKFLADNLVRNQPGSVEALNHLHQNLFLFLQRLLEGGQRDSLQNYPEQVQV